MTSRSFHSLAVSCTPLHVLRPEGGSVVDIAESMLAVRTAILLCEQLSNDRSEIL